MSANVDDEGGRAGLRTPPLQTQDGSPSILQSPYVLVNPQNTDDAGSSHDLPPPAMLFPQSGDAPAARPSTRARTSSRLSTRSATGGARRARPRPRFWLILVLIVLVDVVLEGYVGLRLIAEQRGISINPRGAVSAADPPAGGDDDDDDRQMSQKIISLTVTILGAGAMRCATIAVVAIGNKTDQLGLTVAGVCALSTLILVSVFNLLFQSGMLTLNAVTVPDLPPPSLSLLTSIGLAFTIVEYISYVLVVGIRVPPGGVSAARMREARRWKRGVRESAPVSHIEEREEDAALEVRGGGYERGQEDYRQISTPTPRGRGSGQGSPLMLGATSSRSGSRYGAVDESDRGLSHSRSPSRSVPEQHLLSTSLRSKRSIGSGGDAGGGGGGGAGSAVSSPRAQAFPLSQQGHDGEDREDGDAEEDQDRDLEAGRDQDDSGNLEDDSLNDDDDDDDDANSSDPDEIMDIPSSSTSTTRDQSRARLALAMTHDPEERKRRSRTLSQLSRRLEEEEEEEERDDDVVQDEADRQVAADSSQTTDHTPRKTPSSRRPRFGISFSSPAGSSDSPRSAVKGKEKMSARIKSVFKR